MKTYGQLHRTIPIQYPRMEPNGGCGVKTTRIHTDPLTDLVVGLRYEAVHGKRLSGRMVLKQATLATRPGVASQSDFVSYEK